MFGRGASGCRGTGVSAGSAVARGWVGRTSTTAGSGGRASSTSAFGAGPGTSASLQTAGTSWYDGRASAVAGGRRWSVASLGGRGPAAASAFLSSSNAARRGQTHSVEASASRRRPAVRGAATVREAALLATSLSDGGRRGRVGRAARVTLRCFPRAAIGAVGVGSRALGGCVRRTHRTAGAR